MTSSIHFGAGIFQLYYQNKPVTNPASGKLLAKMASDAGIYLKDRFQPNETVFEREVSYVARVINDDQVEGVFLIADGSSSLNVYCSNKDFFERKVDHCDRPIQRLNVEEFLKSVFDLFAFSIKAGAVAFELPGDQTKLYLKHNTIDILEAENKQWAEDQKKLKKDPS